MPIDIDTQKNESVLVEAHRKEMKSFWAQYEEAPTVESMMLNKDAGSFCLEDQHDILKVMPDLTGKKVVELGAGIGRFTGEMAKTANDVLSTDFIASFVEENQRRHAHLDNCRFQVVDAMGMKLENESVDFVFTNWLLMYLTHTETVTFLRNCLTWLAPNGQMHIRESCSQPSTKHRKKDAVENPTFYRHISCYLRCLQELRIPNEDGKGAYGFKVEWAKSVSTYIKVNSNWRQVHLMVRKVEILDDNTMEIPTIVDIVGDETRLEQDDYDSVIHDYRVGLGNIASPLQPILISEAVNVGLAPNSAVVTLSASPRVVSVAAQKLSTALDSGVESLLTEDLDFSAQLGIANEARHPDVRFLWTQGFDGEVSTWQAPLAFFNLALGGSVFANATDVNKVASNIRELLSTGGSFVTLEPSHEDTFQHINAVKAEFAGVQARDVTDKVKEALKSALDKTTWKLAAKEIEEALNNYNHWFVVTGRKN